MCKLIYIAGPYTAKTQLSIEANIHKARTAALWCAEHGVYYFCPHLNSAFFGQYAPKVPVDFYYGMDMRIAETCDGVLMLDGYHRSKGASLELKYFRESGKRTFFFSSSESLHELLRWNKE